MVVGRLASIWRYPVKSLAGECLTDAEVGASGIPGDRSSVLVVRSGHAREGKAYRGKEHERLHLTCGIDAAIDLGRERGVELERHDGEHFFDDAPVSMLFDHWLAELRAALGYDVEPERFRSNFFVRAAPEFRVGELELPGALLDIGGVRLRVRSPIGRCVTPTYDLHTGVSDPAILRFIAQHRDNRMGIYCDVVTTGAVHVGDAITLSDA